MVKPLRQRSKFLLDESNLLPWIKFMFWSLVWSNWMWMHRYCKGLCKCFAWDKVLFVFLFLVGLGPVLLGSKWSYTTAILLQLTVVKNFHSLLTSTNVGRNFFRKIFSRRLSAHFNPSYQNETHFIHLPFTIYHRQKQASGTIDWEELGLHLLFLLGLYVPTRRGKMGLPCFFSFGGWF